jgi:hypothetical protein
MLVDAAQGSFYFVIEGDYGGENWQALTSAWLGATRDRLQDQFRLCFFLE